MSVMLWYAHDPTSYRSHHIENFFSNGHAFKRTQDPLTASDLCQNHACALCAENNV